MLEAKYEQKFGVGRANFRSLTFIVWLGDQITRHLRFLFYQTKIKLHKKIIFVKFKKNISK